MNDNIKIALIYAGATIACVCLWIYFSPFQTCVRTGDYDAWQCARAVGGWGN